MKLSEKIKDFVNDIAWPHLDSESEYLANEIVGKVKDLEKENAELKLINQQQLESIEKMKCCFNCTHNRTHPHTKTCLTCKRVDRWELTDGNEDNWQMRGE
jgi:multimeric flavodoxin WrbA